MISAKCGNVTVRIYRPRKSGGRWNISYRLPDGSRRNESRATQQESLDRAKALAESLSSGEIVDHPLTQMEVAEYRHAVAQLKGIPLLVAVRECQIYRQQHHCQPKPVADCVSEFIDAKTKAGVVAAYVKNLRLYLQPLANQYERVHAY